MSAEGKLEGIAIIGMAGRFPKARNIDEFWLNLRHGVEGISFFDEQELEAAGVRVPKNEPNYVKARGVLENADLFDAAFFGVGPKEAEAMDPQHRVFLECAWEALESAGCDPDRYDGSIGVFAGMSMNSYLAHNLRPHPELIDLLGEYQVMLGNDKDFLPTRVSYKLNLKGPSLNIQTACSTSLVAVCVACQNLLNYTCDMALAGAVSISFPQKRGYLFQEGGIASPDGHCRAFDAKAAGTIAGEGAGIVVLKRLDEALAEGDPICAVIKGFAVNNDGSLKIGYTAPSVEGQAEVIAMAQAMAGFEPETIGYIEAHGTGTPLGDPIEMEGLIRAFRAGTAAKNFCGVGSVKGNIGHLDTAAGVAGLIKTALALQHKLLPRSLHFETPNPKIDFANSPFYVNSTLREWKAGSTPRRAGVSSFGIGGTNAHVVLEEAPAREAAVARRTKSRPLQLLLLSAKTETALDQAAAHLAQHLQQNPDVDLADVAWTLQTGRRAFPQRRMLVCREGKEAAEILETRDTKRLFTGSVEQENPPVVFLFPGQGAQQVNMGRELYEHEPVFREQVDGCCEMLKPHLGLDLRSVLHAETEQAGEAERRLKETWLTQPALFVIEYALAKLWMSWGIEPEALLGHSIGEYVAACLAGVFSLPVALGLVAARGRMMQQLPGGAMLAVRMPEREVLPLLKSQLSLAAVNGPSLCVVSGPLEAVQDVQRELSQRGIVGALLQTSHAFHSAMMEPILASFTELVSKVKLHAPKIPCISNVTGIWMTAAQSTDPAYWARHLRQTVRFADGLTELFQQRERILLEVGPGQTLGHLAKQHSTRDSKTSILPSLSRANDATPDLEILLGTLGQLWLRGLRVDWPGFHGHERRHRVRLPAYPFERRRYWVEPAPAQPQSAAPQSASENSALGSNGCHLTAVELKSKPAGRSVVAEPSQEASLNGCAARRDGLALPSLVPNSTAVGCQPVRSGEPTEEMGQASGTRQGRITSELRALLGELSGRPLAELKSSAAFVELGFDSLFLSQASVAIQKRFQVKVAFRQLLDDFSTLDTLGTHIESMLASIDSKTQTARMDIPAPRPDSPAHHTENGASLSVPLTEAQKELWFASQKSDGASCAYNETRLLHFRGPLEVAALRQALRRLVDRHEALRTTFSARGDVQQILPRLELDVPFTDLSQLDPEAREAQLEALEGEEARKPFSLTEGPLLRAQVVRLTPEQHRLLLTIHHIVCDGRSWGILLREMSELYSAECQKVPARLGAPLQLSEFAREQARQQSTSERAADEDYWINQFSDGAPVLELPSDRPRPPAWTFDGARAGQTIGLPLIQGLKRLSAQHNCTLFTTLLAAYSLLLHRLTGQDDIVAGIPTADRAMEGSEALVGHCINFLPVRVRVAGNPAFSEFLAGVKKTFLEAYGRQHCTFGQLVQKLNLPRDPSRTPLVSATFNVDRLGEPPGFAGLEMELALSRKTFSNFDLSFNVTELGEELRLDCRYRTALFNPETVQRWLGHFCTLLAAIAANPSQRIGELPLLTEAERHQIVVEWNDTRTKYPADKTLPQLFEEQAAKTPHAVAVTFEETHLTYDELNRRANQLAHHLRSLGVGPEVLAGIFMEHSLEMAVGLLGILKAGGAYLPLDPVYPKDRLAFMLADGRTPVLLTQQRFQDHLPELPAKVICLDTNWDQIARESEENPPASSSADNLAYVIYTSGSTGQPKGSLVTHHNVVRLMQATQPWFHFNERDVWTLFHSHAFDFSVWEYWGALLYGGRLVIVPYWVSRSPQAFHDLLVKEQVTVLNQTPSAFRQFMAAEAAAEMPPKLALRLVIFGGEALELPGLNGWFARHGDERPQLVNMYGITETTVHVTYRPLRAADVQGGSVIGVPIPDLQVYILDQYGQPAPIGVLGEMHVGGAGLARGYLARPELTAGRFVPNPFSAEPGARLYRTGDLARFLPGRDIEYLGRIDDQVKIRGFRIELGEIEAVLSQHAGVRECVVIVRADATGGKQLVAYCTSQAGGQLHPEELRQHLRQKLPDYMTPAAFVTLPSLPLTAHGKVDRRALPAPQRTHSESEATFVAPATPAEEALAQIWRDVLGLKQVGVLDNFFELGGHSLLITQVISRVRETFQVELPMRRFFESPTISALAAILEELLIGQINQLSEEEAQQLLANA